VTTLDEVYARAAKEVDEGLLPAAQVAVAKDGELLGQRTFGDAVDDSLFTIFSATKPLVASGIWLLLQDGLISAGVRVADVVPEFATNGKDVITLEQVMLHASGFPLAPFAPDEWNSAEKRRERFSQWRLNWEPGSRFEYHPTAAHWVLVDVIERVTGQDFRAFLRSRVLDPLGLADFYLGLPGEQNARVADVSYVGEAPTEDEIRALGFPIVPEGEVTEEAILRFNDPTVRAAGCPGGGGITTAAGLALFYQAILADLNGAGRLWDKRILEDVMVVRTTGMSDPYTGVPTIRGLGVVIAGDDGKKTWRGFGHSNSATAFGHLGAGGQVGWGDPETGLSLGYVTNGFDRHPVREGRRGVGISSRAASLTT
jgi:CubicO group peptidase (beta-lactamase class C family)